METATLVFWILTFVAMAAFIVSAIGYVFDIDNCFETGSISLCLFIIFFICAIVFSAICGEQSNPEVKEYPLTEWKMDYKVTTIGENSDTTLVLTKIR